MQESPLTLADAALVDSVAGLRAVGETAGDAELLGVLSVCERVIRELEQTTLAAISELESRGVFAARGYVTRRQGWRICWGGTTPWRGGSCGSRSRSPRGPP